jgi:hypothetical protein
MPTTSNFGWTTPADTDLVKDGALAIRTLGNGIDTSFLDLKGGTTGQVLAKASNTDLDFTWSAADPLSILDAKGDLISATAADTPARLAVGANNTVLTADSSTATGLKWATPAGGKVLQVVQATYSTATTIASQTYTDTGLSISITPSSASSKVLLLVSQMIYWYREADEAGSAIRLMRDSTAILDNFGARGNFFHRFLTNGTEELVEHATQGSLVYLDSPATTSAITYKTQGRAKSTANVGTLICQESSTTSVIIAMEIGA